MEAKQPATHQVLDWLMEREANARAIATRKTGVDRDGWLEDAEYFKAAAAKVWEHAAAIAALKDVLPYAEACVGPTWRANPPSDSVITAARKVISKALGSEA